MKLFCCIANDGKGAFENEGRCERKPSRKKLWTAVVIRGAAYSSQKYVVSYSFRKAAKTGEKRKLAKVGTGMTIMMKGWKFSTVSAKGSQARGARQTTWKHSQDYKPGCPPTLCGPEQPIQWSQRQPTSQNGTNQERETPTATAPYEDQHWQQGHPQAAKDPLASTS